MTENPNPSSQPTLIGGPENMKLLFDDQLSNARETQARARAWEDLALRRAHNVASFDHAVNAGIVLQGQTGSTENQQTVSPAGTAASEAIKGGVGVSAEAVAAAVANTITSSVPALAAVFAALAQSGLLVVPVGVTAAGGASTPSQTQPKPTA